MKKITIIRDDLRNSKMREALGDANKLIDGNIFLTMFRKIQNNFRKENEASVKMMKNASFAGKIKDKKGYFAKIWSKKNLEKTLRIMREFLNRQISKLAEKRERKKQNECDEITSKSFNNSSYAKFQAMKHNFNLS